MFVFVQYGCRKIHQINKVCADFQLLLNFKYFLLSGQKRKRASRGGSYDTAEVALLEINVGKEENWFCCPLFSAAQLDQKDSIQRRAAGNAQEEVQGATQTEQQESSD